MSLSKVASYAFYNHPNLESVKVSAPSIEQYAFQNAAKLQVVDLTSDAAVNIAANAFSGCSSLEDLIVRSSTASTLAATSALTGTKIARGEGGIYVPAALVDTYKAKTGWLNYPNNIFPISEYPKRDYSSITDSWAEIVTNSDYATDYSVGDTKLLELTDGTKLYMQLVGINADTKSSDHTGKARMTWLCKNLYTSKRMNATGTTSGGWGDTEIRSWLRSDVLPLIPTVVRTAIVEVDKTYRSKSPNDETLTIADTIWIPSYKEVGFTNAAYVESDGVVYSVFNSNANRIKYNASGSAAVWWLRSAYSAAGFRCVYNGGNESNNSANGTNGVVFGFCI